MASKGNVYPAAHPTLRTACVNCGQSFSMEVGPARPLEIEIRLHTWALVGYQVPLKKVFPTCSECLDAGWRPPGFVWMN